MTKDTGKYMWNNIQILHPLLHTVGCCQNVTPVENFAAFFWSYFDMRLPPQWCFFSFVTSSETWNVWKGRKVDLPRMFLCRGFLASNDPRSIVRAFQILLPAAAFLGLNAQFKLSNVCHLWIKTFGTDVFFVLIVQFIIRMLWCFGYNSRLSRILMLWWFAFMSRFYRVCVNIVRVCFSIVKIVCTKFLLRQGIR